MRGTLGQYQEIESLRDKMIEVLTAITSSGEIIEEEPIKITIKQNFKDACPKFSEKEYEDLKKLIMKDGKILQPLLLWNGILVDGHNRYAIALKHNIPFTTQELRFKNENEVIIWIKENAISQRNLTDFAKYELIKDIEEVLKVKAKERQKNAGKGIKTDEPKMTVREEMAEKIDVSPSQLRKMKEFDEKAPVELKEEVRKGKVKLGTALKEIKPKEEPTDNAKIKTAARELEKWVIKYTDESLLTSYVNEVTDIAIRIKESL